MGFQHPLKVGDHVKLHPDILRRPCAGAPGSEFYELYKRLLHAVGVVIHVFDNNPHTQVRFNVPSRWRAGFPGYKGTLGLSCDDLVATGEHTPPVEADEYVLA